MKAALGKKDDPLTLVLRDTWKPLPATRGEVLSIVKLVTGKGGSATSFFGPEANAANLEKLAAKKELSRFRYLHLATHGKAHADAGMTSYLALTSDDVKITSYAKLSAGEIMRTWKLDADLVTLSCCETARGEARGGEGFIGFAQALLLAGAQTLVLTQWQTSEAASPLIMERFYQNFLGARDGLKAPLAKLEALEEAKMWLRNLGKKETLERLDAMEMPAKDRDRTYRSWLTSPLIGDRPFEHPFFWSPFILVGDAGR